jgi:hypothetical protein
MAKSWLFNRRKYMPSKALTGLQSLKPGERSISEHSPPGLNVGPVMTHRISTPQNSTVSQHLFQNISSATQRRTRIAATPPVEAKFRVFLMTSAKKAKFYLTKHGEKKRR